MPNEQPIPDEILVKRAMEGDEQAASRLYHRYADRVYGICYRIVLHAALAKDCSQEVWLKVFKELHRYQERYTFQAWLTTIAARTAIDEYRKRSRRPGVALSEDLSDQIPDPQSATARRNAEEGEIRSQIEKALADLSDAQRSAFVLRHFEGEEIPEISRILGCNPGTAKTHIHRAVHALRKSLAFLQEKVSHV